MRGMMRTLLALLLAIAAGAPSLWAFPLQVAGLDTTRTAVWIRDLRWGNDVVKANIDTSLVPASVMKSITAASLLNLADPAERFATQVYATGTVNADGVLDGDIVIRASGDPTIESQFFPANLGFADSIVAGVRRLGIRAVSGSVIVDESDFPDATTPPGWMAEDIVWPYGARLHGANFRDNRFRLRYPSRETSPHVPDIKFSVVPGKGRGAKIDRKDGSETFIVSGNTRRGVSDTFSMPYPRKAMQAEVASALREAGIEVRGAATAQPGADTMPVYTHLSPAFGDILRSLMHRSDNLMAEGMQRAIAPGGTRADAIRELNAIWTLAGISPHGVKIVDGSGLSRDDRLTARFLGEVNMYMLADEFGTDYTSLFPRAGRDGTMRGFLAGTPLEGRVAMKTGSMKGVQSYSGYLFDEEGTPTHILVFMVNGFRCSRAALKNAIQKLLLDTFCVSLQNERQE